MPTILLKPLQHLGRPQIAIIFPYDKEIKLIIKKLHGIKWSRTHSVYYLADTPNNRKRLINYLKGTNYQFDTLFLSNKKVSHQRQRRPENCTRHAQALIDYKRYLVGKRYSENTIKVYSGFILEFLVFHKMKILSSLNNRDVELFIEEVVVSRQYSISTHRQVISALKLFIRLFPRTEISDLENQRPKKSKILPTVLSQQEIIDLLRNTKNIKHRAVLGLLYSSGLRVGELINLELRHINIDRRQILIKDAKGRKDRYVVLSEGFLPLLTNYVQTYGPRRYFVEGPLEKPYSASSIRKFLYRSCKAAGITKKVTPHTLRHSYATHLLENGIGIRHIQELLGHSKPETTMIYTHVAKKDLLDILSPLDTILLQLSKRYKEEQNVLLSQNIIR